MNANYRPKIQNGQVIKRPRTTAGSYRITNSQPTTYSVLTPAWEGPSVTALTQTGWSAGLSALGLDERLRTAEINVQAATKTTALSQTKTMMGLISCGLVLAGAFMFSLRDHFSAHASGREQIQLQSQIKQATTIQNTLEGQRQRAASPGEIERAAALHTNLASITPDEKKVMPVAANTTTKNSTSKQTR